MSRFARMVRAWVLHCFGPKIADDKRERAMRLLEEAMELAQACDVDTEDALRLVHYVFQRPVGDRFQEIGGVMVTLYALAAVLRENVDDAAWRELERVWVNVEHVRSKHGTKPDAIAYKELS